MQENCGLHLQRKKKKEEENERGKRREKAVPPADGGPREPTRGNASEREKERENLMSTASRMHRSVFGTRKVGAVVAGARANASRRAPNHNQALPRNNTLNTERRGHKHHLVVTAAASEAAEAAEVESRSTLRIKLKCYSAEPLQVRLLFLLRKKKKRVFLFLNLSLKDTSLVLVFFSLPFFLDVETDCSCS